MNALNAATATDFYKPGHGPLYPAGTTRKYSNFTPRSAKNFIRSKSCSSFYDNKVVNFGLYGSWQELVALWDRTFFQVSKEKAVKAIKRRFDNACGPDVISVAQIAALHDVGFLPVTVLSIEEGNRVNVGIPLWVIYNSEEYPEHYWLVNYLETVTSSYNWQSITNATIAYEYRRVMEHWAEKTCDNNLHVKIQGHDFSFRGMPGPEAAARSNSGHLVSFIGTDTIPAIDYVEEYYHADSDKEILGVSVTATEHAVATANILTMFKHRFDAVWDANHGDMDIVGPLLDKLKLECERDYIRQIITEKVNKGIISLVCDSFDFWGVIAEVLPSLRTEIEARIKNEIGLAKVVVRPDSGDPVKVITGFKLVEYNTAKEFDDALYNLGWEAVNGEAVRVGDKYYELRNHDAPNAFQAQSTYEDFLGREMSRAEAIGAIDSLYESFGGHVNGKGYKVLNEYIGLIYGDSITVERAEQIFERLEEKGYASSNVVLGIGSFTYQFNTRDTFGMAMKATACEVNAELIELYKDPKTAASKKSAKGFLRVVRDAAGNYTLEQEVEMDWKDLFYGSGELKPLWHNGKFQRAEFFRDARDRLDRTFLPADTAAVNDGFEVA
ncbi:nicotinamide phosphoribosyl transferase [Pseudomonas phage Psa21]|uniref:Nicotinamide phosphoribosyltransferase n=1 Tax=Pseudomonas phage Psa21 TaxID=2530023 RepID=A0A481W4U1_9CAUD|nr:nicotinamide phosphoribosyl transferase [Pseudomonas phage Psa21]QBJ02830.1 nicotinamide phosphoribosyltransferase [Pseudomonas phage Psa21]